MTPPATDPAVSVIIATRDAASMLRATLESLARQTEGRFEVIIVDGASTDDTALVAGSFPGMTVSFQSESDTGIANAWNKGIGRSRGSWITFLNAGDLFHPRHIERACARLMQASHRTILYCDVQKFRPDGTATHMIPGTPPTRSSILRGSIGFAHPGSLTHRDAFAELGRFDESVRIALDTDFLLRAFSAGFSFERFASCAYMEEGGISDRRFALGIQEFFRSACRQGLASNRSGRVLAFALPLARRTLHLLRRLNSPARAAKHALVTVANAISLLLPLASLRRLYYSAMGFELGRGCSIGYGTYFYVPGRFRMGARSVLNRDCLMDNRGTIEIGADCSISREVRIFTAGHDIDSPLFDTTFAPVRLGHHVVVFARASIMPGVTIGDGAVVYADSVVTRDVPPMTVVGGNPALPIRVRRSSLAYRLNYPYPMAM